MHGVDVELDGTDLNRSVLDRIYGHPVRVRLAPQAIECVRRGRAHVERILKLDRPFYGINTGFAQLCDKRIPADQLDALQENLLLSHAVGVGDPTPDDIVRWMLLFKIHALSLGHSGVRTETLDTLVALLNNDLLPVVPCKGSLGASGDLAPLAHLCLPLIGRGELRQGDKVVPASDALREHGITPVCLGAKEGLALINGTQFMTAYGAALCVRARRVCKTADVLAAMTLEAIGGHLAPFDERLHELRPHPGAIAVATNIRQLLAGRPEGRSPTRVQDPYSVRCVPQVHGAARDVLEHVETVVLRDINSVTDNPVIVGDGDVLSGGSFHGDPVAMALDYLAIALAELGSISERRQYLLINNGNYGLPVGLIEEGGLNSGLLITQYTSAALVSENKILCHPASVDSIPTAGGQEDHVSMGATAAVKCWQVMENLETIQAIELVTAAQALDFTPHDHHASAIRAAHAVVRRRIRGADTDRELAPDFASASEILMCQELLK